MLWLLIGRYSLFYIEKTPLLFPLTHHLKSPTQLVHTQTLAVKTAHTKKLAYCLTLLENLNLDPGKKVSMSL